MLKLVVGVIQLLSPLQLFVTPLTAAQQASLSKISGQFSSVAQSCPTLCNPMNRSTPGLPVHHQLPEFTQTHIHRVSDAILPSHPLSSPSPPAPIPPSIRVFSSESTLCMRWPNIVVFFFKMQLKSWFIMSMTTSLSANLKIMAYLVVLTRSEILSLENLGSSVKYCYQHMPHFI